MPSYRLTKEWQKIEEKYGVVENTTSQNIEVAITSGDAEPLKGGGKLLNGGALFPFHLFENQTIWARAFKIVPSLPVPALAVNSLADLQNKEDNPLEGATDRLTIGISRWYKNSWWPIDWCVTVDGALWQCTEEHYGSDDFKADVAKGYWACLLMDQGAIESVSVQDKKLIVVYGDGSKKEYTISASSAMYDDQGNIISNSIKIVKDECMSEIKQTAESITALVERYNADKTTDISKLKQTAEEITSTVEKNKSDTEKELSVIRQTASEISSTVSSNKSNADNQLSEIRQTISSLETTVRLDSASATTDISKLKQTALQISSTVEAYNNARLNDISEVKQTARELSATVQSNKSAADSEISKLKQTANEISSTVINNKSAVDKEISEIKQTASSISSTVSSNKSAVDREIAEIKQTASSISSTVSSLSSNTQSQINQLSDSINFKVSKGDVVNQINMTADGTKINGKHLHITGETVFDDDVTVKGTIAAGAIKKINLDGTVVDALQNTMEGSKDESKWKGIFIGSYYTGSNYITYSSWTAPADGVVVASNYKSWKTGSSDDNDVYYKWPIVKINGTEIIDTQYTPTVNPTVANGLQLTRTETYPESITASVKKGDLLTSTHFMYGEITSGPATEYKKEQDFSNHNVNMSCNVEGIFKPYDWNE